MNIFNRQSICIYLLFGLSNLDFEERNFGLPFTRVTLSEKIWPLVLLFGDDSIAGKLQKSQKRPSEIVMNHNELYLFYLLFELSSERLCRAIVWDVIVLNGNKKGGKLFEGNYVKVIYLGFRGNIPGSNCLGNHQWSFFLRGSLSGEANFFFFGGGGSCPGGNCLALIYLYCLNATFPFGHRHNDVLCTVTCCCHSKMQNNIPPGHHDMNLSKHSQTLFPTTIFKCAILLQFSEYTVF